MAWPGLAYTNTQETELRTTRLIPKEKFMTFCCVDHDASRSVHNFSISYLYLLKYERTAIRLPGTHWTRSARAANVINGMGDNVCKNSIQVIILLVYKWSINVSTANFSFLRVLSIAIRTVQGWHACEFRVHLGVDTRMTDMFCVLFNGN